MNMIQWQKDYLNNPRHKAMPVLSFPGAQLIGATVRDLVTRGDQQARCLQAVAARYPTLAAVSNMDLSVEAQAFGAQTVIKDDEVPAIIGSLVDTEQDARNLKVPAVGAGRTGEYIRAISLAKQQIQDRPLIAGMIGPFSLTGRLFDMTEVVYKATDEPHVVHLVLEKVTQFLIAYSQAFKAAGADGIIMAEPAAGLLSPDWNAEFSAPYVRRIVEAVQDEQFLVIYHNCGKTVQLVPEIVATGARAFHFGNAISLTDVIGQIPEDRLVMGNIDPVGQIARGNPETIRAAVAELRREMSGHANFVLSSGCDIPAYAPLANLDAFFQAAE